MDIFTNLIHFPGNKTKTVKIRQIDFAKLIAKIDSLSKLPNPESDHCPCFCNPESVLRYKNIILICLNGYKYKKHNICKKPTMVD